MCICIHINEILDIEVKKYIYINISKNSMVYISGSR